MVIKPIKRFARFTTGCLILCASLFSHTYLLSAPCNSNFSENYVTSSGGFENPKSIESQDSDPDSCQHWFGWHAINPGSPTEFIMQYDTLKHYIESCAKNDNDSWRAFIGLNANVQQFDTKDTTRYWRYRDWLVSVLYLNSSDMYYCTCLKSIAGTYKYDGIPNAWLGVIKFMLTTSSCYTADLQAEYTATINNRHNLWLKGDTTIPEDTTIPTLHELGLDFLLNHGSVQSSKTPSESYLTYVTSSPNPFKNETHLHFHLNRMTYTTIGIYDVLGHQVWGSGSGKSLEAGDHQVVVDGSLLPDGALYARIETGFGEVKTVKLVHQE